MRVGKLKNGKAAGKEEIIGEIIKGGGDRVMDSIWRQWWKVQEKYATQ